MPANVQPIYPREPFIWNVRLTNQLAPRNITTQVPVLLGTAGVNGALIHCINCVPLGDNIATVIRFYTKQTVGDTNYFLQLEHSLSATSGANEANKLNFATPGDANVILPNILPSPNTGFHLPPSCALYAALGTAIANGINAIVRGGNY